MVPILAQSAKVPGVIGKASEPLNPIWAVLKNRVPFRVLLIRVPYYIGDLKGDPNLENYPSRGDWGMPEGS